MEEAFPPSAPQPEMSGEAGVNPPKETHADAAVTPIGHATSSVTPAESEVSGPNPSAGSPRSELPAGTHSPVTDFSTTDFPTGLPPSNPNGILFSPTPAQAVAPLTPEPPAYTDRSTGLTIFGVFQIVLGLFAALMIPFAALGAFMSRFAPGGGTVRPMQMLSGMATYAFLAAAFITLGAGSIRMRRWAHALTVVSSWYWLISGVLITILMTAMMPVTMRSALAHAQQTTPNAGSTEFATGFMAVIVTVMIVFMAFFLIAVPIAFLVFYSRDDVYQTCRSRDPVERWTDRAPLPVLGASVVLFVGSLYLLSVGLTMPMFPFFGRYLTGVAGAAGFVVLAAIDVCLAIGIFQLRPEAWWFAVTISPIRLISMIVTYRKADSMQAYAKLGWSDAQMEMMRSNPMFRGHIILWWSLVSVFVFFGYLLWLKRYFKPSTTADAGSLEAHAS